MTALDHKPSKLINRLQWEALPPKQVKLLKTPVSNVVGTYAEVDPCFTTEECILRMREIQKKHMDQHLSDIQYNFVIGGDGNIYQGRGWGSQGPTYSKRFKHGEELTGNSIEVAFMDHYKMTPSEGHMVTATDCIAMGMVGKYLTEKVNFYWKTPYDIAYVETYDLNSSHYILPKSTSTTTTAEIPSK